MLDLALDTRIFINNELDAALQELDMIFNTENTELIGYPQYGTNWYQFLWQLDYSPEDLQKLCSFFKDVATARSRADRERDNISKKYNFRLHINCIM